MSNTTLKPCPFCGAKVKLAGGPMAQETYQIYCQCQAEMCGGFDAAKLVERWNSRATGWIDIKERKPEFGDHCLFVIEALDRKYVVSGHVDRGGFAAGFADLPVCDNFGVHLGYEADFISHWMALPEIPAKAGAA